MMLARRNNNVNWMSNLFDDFFYGSWLPQVASVTPAVNVKETESAYEMEVAAPGLKKDCCHVNLNEEGNLVVRLESKSERKDDNESGHYLRREFSYNNYEQSYLLPKNVDKDSISARVEDGILCISMPKVAHGATKQERVIDIE